MLPAQSNLRHLIPLALLISLISIQISAQQEKPQDSDDVVRVKTELVQTDVMVFDKQGRFIEDLTPAQFVLKVDGKPREISFFERVVAGSVNEDAQLAAARGRVRESGGGPSGVRPLDRGRMTVFFVDDLHLGPDNLRRTKESIARFIENELGQNDKAVVTSPTGSIGFLQQVTSERAVLRAALKKIVYKPYSATDRDRPLMSEYQAIRIEGFDRNVLDFFVEQIMRDSPGISRDTAETMVRNRATAITQFGTSVTRNTLYSVLGLVRSMGSYGGRKVLFLFSDGFFLDTNNSTVLDLIRRITDQARRSNVVIYSIDSRGLIPNMPDASTEVVSDPAHRLDASNSGEFTASQDGMSVLASDTGGRFLRNTNDLKTPVKKTLQETATYYLLAWRPEEVEGNSVKFRKIDISIPSRPELTLRVRKGVYERELESPKKPAPKKKESSPPTIDDTLRGTLAALVPPSELPTALSLHYMDTPDKGPVLSAVMEIDPSAVTLRPEGDKFRGIVAVAGVVLNAEGKQVSGFKDQLDITSRTAESLVSAAHGPAYSYQIAMKPGLYQVRIATLDQNNKKAGGATQWLEIPDLRAGVFAMGTILLAERHPAASANESAGGGAIMPGELSINHRFNKTSYLRFLTYIYNAKTSNTARPVPDLAVQVQLFRDNQPVLTTALRKVPVEDLTDPARVPYAAETNLAGLPPGEYVLTVTTIDRIAKASASSRASFLIE